MGYNVSYFGSQTPVMSENASLCEAFTFNAAAQSISCNEQGFRRYLFIINVTDGVVIYNPSNAGTTGLRVSRTTMRLTYDTTAMSDTDDLLVFIDRVENDVDARASKDALEEMLLQTKLLNERIEQAFETGINLDDIEDM